MTLGKTTISNSVKYIPQNEQTRERYIKQKHKNVIHFLVNKTKIFRKTKNISLEL